jgi:hypothetical protein
VTAEAIPAVASVVAEGMAGGEILPESVTWVTAQADDAATPVIGDPASQGASETLVGLLEGQQPLFKQRSDLTGTGLSEQLTTLTATTAQAMGAQMVATTPPMHLRGLRRAVNAEPLVDLPSVAATVQLEVGALADSVLTNVRPLPQQLRRMNDLIASADVERRAASDARPLRRIMAHPRFGMPIAAELLSRWPEWAVPGISTFPPNSATLLETNSPFVEAMLVGLNQEFNRELLWREFPTDQRGTAFARFWPSERDNPEVDEIARWPLEVDLGGAARARGGAAPLPRRDCARRQVAQRPPA